MNQKHLFLVICFKVLVPKDTAYAAKRHEYGKQVFLGQASEKQNPACSKCRLLLFHGWAIWGI